jgi:hypothetical protein
MGLPVPTPAAPPPAAAAPLPPMLDLREPGTGGRLSTPVVRQPAGDPNCCSYAFAAAMETFLCRERNTVAGVPRLSVDDVVAKAREDGQTLHDVALSAKVRAGVRDTAAVPGTWVPTFRQLVKVKSEMPDAMRRALVAGFPLAVSVPIYPKKFMTEQGVKVYAPDGSYGAEDGAHALCVVGYTNDDIGRPCWIARNSYGPAWGDRGYTLLPIGHDKLNTEVSGVYAVEGVRRA